MSIDQIVPLAVNPPLPVRFGTSCACRRFELALAPQFHVYSSNCGKGCMLTAPPFRYPKQAQYLTQYVFARACC
jgi:hypothetical protein